MLRTLLPLALAVTCASTGTSAMAQMTPVGLWQTMDDADGSVKSEVRIVDNAGVVSGRIEKILDPKAKPGATCIECTDERKDQAIQGMEILRDLKKADGKDQWEGGNVLDPNNGKVYRATLALLDGGKKLQMRGYIGFFYRTQIWTRVQ